MVVKIFVLMNLDFDPIRDNEDSRPFSPETSDLANLEQFLYHNLPRLFRSALETEVNHEIQLMEERFRDQLPNLVEHTLSRAIFQYHAMVDDNSRIESSQDSGYASNHSRTGSSPRSKGKGPASAVPMDSAIPSRTNPNDSPNPPEALPPPFIETAPASNAENTAYMTSSFGSMGSSEDMQFQESASNEFESSGWRFSDVSSFPDQIDCPMSNTMNLDSFNWELPLQEELYSNCVT